MLPDSPSPNPSPLGARSWPAVLPLVASVFGIALLFTILVMGPTTLASLQPSWLIALVSLVGIASAWWAVYFWLLARLGGLSLAEGIRGSVGLTLFLSMSLVPASMVFLAGRLPFTLVFDGNLRSVYIWIAGLMLFAVFVGQELVLAGASRTGGIRRLLADGLARLAAFPGWVAGLPALLFRQGRRHPLLVVVLIAGLVQRWQILGEYHPGDMNDLLSVAYTILSGQPFRYYHDYRAQTYIFAHLPLMPLLSAPFYWLFENVAHQPTFYAVKLVSAVADVAVAIVIYSQAKGRWKGALGVAMAACWMLSPLVASNNDRPVSLASVFAIAAFAMFRRDWLCGVLIALGMATRTEVAFLALPLVIHFLTKRELREKVLFLGAAATTLGMIALPFILTDPEAIDFAMRLQGQRQASGQMSELLILLQPYMPGQLGSIFQQNPSYFPALMTLVAALLALRDRRPLRVAVVVAAIYIMGIPVLHDHYTVLFYAAGILYAARYGNPLVAIAAIMVTGTWLIPSFAVHILLICSLILFGLLQNDPPEASPQPSYRHP